MTAARQVLAGWETRQWSTAALVALAYGIAVAVPTDLIDTPAFSREIPPTWWAWPSLVISSVLVGLLVGTYVADDKSAGPTLQGGNAEGAAAAERQVSSYAGAFLTFFAVGCPVCNKLVLLALGYTGAITWFEPFQPILQAAGIALLAWALRGRLAASRSCPVPTT
ncbi:hypothetical protein [Knoellia koreensis]|uniref:hypothetical protein n=1 Tax=Knoellia koreensis TaxID=2730921 RepID=UPI001981CAD4